MRRRLRALVRVTLALAAVLAGISREGAAQEEERPEVTKALNLESEGKYKEAAILLSGLIKTSPSINVLLGLERVYAELGKSDSLLGPLDTLIAANPREPLYRTVQLRTLQILRREEKLRVAFEQWARATPRDAAPYREYARVLIALGRPATADSVVIRGRNALGSLRDLEYENAQLRAALGEWVASAQSWRRVLGDSPYLAGAAAFALTKTPTALRNDVRSALSSFPPDPGARQALANLELSWGNSLEAWEAIRVLRADTAVATIWEEFGQRAYTEERWALAREALSAALKVRRTKALALAAAEASLKAGAPNDVFSLLPMAEWNADSAQGARQYIPLHVAALVALNRSADAEALVARYERHFQPNQRMRAAQMIATSWVRGGDLAKARNALRAAGPDADSSEAAGWLALYEGKINVARGLLRTSSAATPDLALAMGVVARIKGDNAPELGAAFLALARGDSSGAAKNFVEAATRNTEVAPALLLIAARSNGSGKTAPVVLWRRLVDEFSATPEAVEAELEWARTLRRQGDSAGAILHLEHLILSAPQSALLPQARRELEQLRGAVPPGV